MITATDGYTTPMDADANDIYDYKEVGADPVLSANASDVTVTEDSEAVFSVNVTASNTVTYQWQFSLNNGVTWTDVVDDANYSGSNTSELTIVKADISMDGIYYQALISMETYACSSLTTDPPVLLTVLPDSDKDGVEDAIDVDKDNDGILDTEEGTEDIDNDGIPNYLDIDSDGDGCFDVKGAGYTDLDDDGELDGDGVDANGQVTGGDGYTAIADVNNNAVEDYKKKVRRKWRWCIRYLMIMRYLMAC